MITALRHLILTSLAVLICSAMAWFGLRMHGYSKGLQEPVHHPFLEGLRPGRPYVISYAGEAGFPDNTLEGFDEAVRKNPEAVLWADVRPSMDGTLVLFRGVELSETTDGKGWVDYTETAALKKLNAGYSFSDPTGKFPFREHPVHIPTLVEFLKRFPTQKLVLNFANNRPGLAEKITEALDALKVGPRALIQSAEAGLLRDLREKKPDWIFGMSQAHVTQLKMLAAIGLESMAPLSGDVFVTEAQIGQNQMLDDDMRAELLRRKMPIFIGPVAPPAHSGHDQRPAESIEKAVVQKWVAGGVNGIITKHVLILVQ